MEKLDLKQLKKRYLLWLYKTTKEALDRIERKFTQLEVDRVILKELEKQDKSKKAQKQIAEFRAYILNKEIDGISLKYEGKELKPEYYFLDLKLRAIEKTIAQELGAATLSKIKGAYEQEMTRRILEEKVEKT
jgi:ethanolamine ammonia-lyase large subunit